MAVIIRILKGEGEDSSKDLILEKNTILIGRGTAEDVKLTNDSVSRRHCVIERQGAKWVVTDEGSENGTYLNGTPVKGHRELEHSDVLELGEVMLMIGIDKPLESTQKKNAPSVKIGRTVLVLNLAALVFAVFAMLSVGKLYIDYREQVSAMAAPIEPDFSDIGPPGSNQPFDILDQPDRIFMEVAFPANLPGYSTAGARYYVVPEWNLGNVWDTANTGREPRLFEGLDIRLNGGELICLSSYAYLRRSYFMSDVNDPYGEIEFSIEAWGGMGPRIGKEELPMLRREELPHYVRSIRIFPEDIKDYMPGNAAPGIRDGELGAFRFTRTQQPDPYFKPRLQQMLAGTVLPEIEAKEVNYEGRCYAFFHDGCRYELIVRGSASLLERMGGIDEVADKYFSTVRFKERENDPNPPVKSTDVLTAQAAQHQTFLDAFSQKVSVIHDLRYKDLKAARETILEFQRLPEELIEEKPLKRYYFHVYDRARTELIRAMDIIYENRGKADAREGVRQLGLIREFMGDYPPAGLRPGQSGYPEWTRYYEAVRKHPTYLLD